MTMEPARLSGGDAALRYASVVKRGEWHNKIGKRNGKCQKRMSNTLRDNV